ncbi:hypothetical protein [Leifsonia xyli]|uniref:hypothetical protein n=1 Tax=Leifsonia xyli TaxID=1575 RepID=UPI003D6731DB
MSVPALSGPAPQSPGTPQKTITQLLTQWADLTNAAIAATGHTEGWKDDTPLDKSKPWDPAAENVSLAPCGTVGSKTAHQVQAVVYHAAFEPDPHPIADKLTAYWESQGFTVTRTVDWTSPSGRRDISIRATRPDGVYYGLGVSKDLVAIDVYTECSAHPSIQAWAREGSLRDLNAPTPTPTPSANLGEGAADAPTHAAPAATSDPADLFREFHDDADEESSLPTTERTANDDGWMWWPWTPSDVHATSSAAGPGTSTGRRLAVHDRTGRHPRRHPAAIRRPDARPRTVAPALT